MSTLEIRASSSYEETWSDRGTGAKKDLSVWRNRLLDNEYRVAYVAMTNGRNAPRTEGAVVMEGSDSDGGALAPPSCFECVWTDKKTGAPKDGSMWKAIPPAGYKALSDVALHKDSGGVSPGTRKPPGEIDPYFRCVKVSLCKSVELDECDWSDAGSGGAYDGATWCIKDSVGMRVSRGAKDRPEQQQYRLKSFVGNLYKNMTLVFGLDNTSKTEPVPVTHEIQCGLTISKSMSATTKAEYALEVGAKASGGVPGVGSGEASTKFSATLGSSATFSGAETSTQTQTLKIGPFNIPPMTRFELWQMIVTDTKSPSHSGLLIKSQKYEVSESSL